LRDPLEVFEALFPAGQDVDRAFQRDRADPGQPLTDLRPQVERPRRKLMDQHVPRETGDPGHKVDSSNGYTQIATASTESDADGPALLSPDPGGGLARALAQRRGGRVRDVPPRPRGKPLEGLPAEVSPGARRARA